MYRTCRARSYVLLFSLNTFRKWAHAFKPVSLCFLHRFPALLHKDIWRECQSGVLYKSVKAEWKLSFHMLQATSYKLILTSHCLNTGVQIHHCAANETCSKVTGCCQEAQQWSQLLGTSFKPGKHCIQRKLCLFKAQFYVQTLLTVSHRYLQHTFK